MKMILALAFVLLATVATATELKVPGKSSMSKAPPPVVQTTPAPAGETCMQRLERACVTTHRTRLFTKACIRRNAYRCR